MTDVQNIIIGIYNGHLDRQGRYKALIGLELLDYKGGVEIENEFATTIKV